MNAVNYSWNGKMVEQRGHFGNVADDSWETMLSRQQVW